MIFFFFFSSRRRHTRCSRDWSSDVCSSDLGRRVSRGPGGGGGARGGSVRLRRPDTQRPQRLRVHARRSGEHPERRDRKSTRLNSSHGYISYAVFCLKKKTRKK